MNFDEPRLLARGGESARLAAFREARLNSVNRDDGAIRDARRLSAVFFVLFSIYGLNIAFFPVWLGARGLTPDEIGLILALPMVVSIVANQPICAYADRTGRVAQTAAVAAAATAFCYFAMTFAYGFWVILGAVALTSFARAPLMPLMDALTFRLIRRDSRVDYGRVRLWASVSVLVAMLLGGVVVAQVPADRIIWIIVGATSLGALAAIWEATHHRGAKPAELKPHETAQPTRIGLILLVIAASACVQSSHALIYGFGSLHWKAQGASPEFIGFAWAVGVATEIAFFAVAGRLFGGGSRAAALVIVGAAVSVARWALMGMEPGDTLLIVLQASHALTFGATHLGCVYMLSDLLPETMRARAQGWLASANSLSLAVLTAASGPFYTSLGERGYWGMAAVAGAGLVFALILARVAQPQRAASGG